MCGYTATTRIWHFCLTATLRTSNFQITCLFHIFFSYFTCVYDGNDNFLSWSTRLWLVLSPRWPFSSLCEWQFTKFAVDSRCLNSLSMTFFKFLWVTVYWICSCFKSLQLTVETVDNWFLTSKHRCITVQIRAKNDLTLYLRLLFYDAVYNCDPFPLKKE